MHCARDIPLRVLEENQAAHRRNGHFGHDDFPAIRFYCFRDRVYIVHGDAAFESGHPLPFDQFAAALQRTLYARLFLISGLDQKKSGRTPRLEFPTEYFLVESARSRDVIGVDRKMSNVVRHHSQS